MNIDRDKCSRAYKFQQFLYDLHKLEEHYEIKIDKKQFNYMYDFIEEVVDTINTLLNKKVEYLPKERVTPKKAQIERFERFTATGDVVCKIVYENNGFDFALLSKLKFI